KEEFANGTLEGAINIPVDALRERLGELPSNKPVYVFSQIGLRGYIAYRILIQNGFTEVYNLSGGYRFYSMASSRIEPPQAQNRHTPKSNELRKEDSKPQSAAQSCCTSTGQDDAKAMELSEKASESLLKPPSERKRIRIDACGLQCPGPILKVGEAIQSVQPGEELEVLATDPAFATDVEAWCRRTGNECVEKAAQAGQFKVIIRKASNTPSHLTSDKKADAKNMVVFSGDLDKAIASFIIANGAAAMGREVNMFFTFWGLNILRKVQRVRVKKNLIERMFGFMMPRGSKKLGLSKMNMAGMGPMMIRRIMQHKNISSLEELIDTALKNGVKITACSMSMDVMGIKQEELIDGISIGGVASMLASAEESDMSLFI
ncbi:MAG: DsrE/DsrF/DrsH-like family protein, partial [Clostridia bacterium]|nr:DsrE/DsrF/DrsH-like family protein [Clostridia bacterium]